MCTCTHILYAALFISFYVSLSQSHYIIFPFSNGKSKSTYFILHSKTIYKYAFMIFFFRMALKPLVLNSGVDVQVRFDALLVLTFKLSHKKRCSYFRCCDREREFGSVVPFKCKLLNVPKKSKGKIVKYKLDFFFGRKIQSYCVNQEDIYRNFDFELAELDSEVSPIWHLRQANGHASQSNCLHAPPIECFPNVIDANRTEAMQLKRITFTFRN